MGFEAICRFAEQQLRLIRGSANIRDFADIAPNLRLFTVVNYLILDRVLPDGIKVVRCVRGAR